VLSVLLVGSDLRGCRHEWKGSFRKQRLEMKKPTRDGVGLFADLCFYYRHTGKSDLGLSLSF
jgi:hypothetical protein